MNQVQQYRMVVVLLAAALLATLTVALTGGDRADAVDGPVETVYVATGRNFPDALAGATLATTTGAPLLTVEPDLPLPDATVDALTALAPEQIVVLGGPGAVSAEVFEALTDHATSGNVSRIEGSNRHDTAAAIADALPDRVANADLLDGLDSTAFLRRQASRQLETRFATCGPHEMAGQLDRTVMVNTADFLYRRLLNTESLANLSCNISIPEGATIRKIGYDAHDSSDAGWVTCQYLRVNDRSEVPPVLLGLYDPDLGSSDSFLTTGVAETPGDVRMTTELNDGPVVAGALTQVHISCYLRGDTNARLYGYVVEYTLPPHAHD